MDIKDFDNNWTEYRKYVMDQSVQSVNTENEIDKQRLALISDEKTLQDNCLDTVASLAHLTNSIIVFNNMMQRKDTADIMTDEEKSTYVQLANDIAQALVSIAALRLKMMDDTVSEFVSQTLEEQVADLTGKAGWNLMMAIAHTVMDKPLREFFAYMRLDNIEDDEDFCIYEHDLLLEYCHSHGFILTHDDMECIAERGLTDDFLSNVGYFVEDTITALTGTVGPDNLLTEPIRMGDNKVFSVGTDAYEVKTFIENNYHVSFDTSNEYDIAHPVWTISRNWSDWC